MTLTELEDELRRMRASVSTQADREAELQVRRQCYRLSIEIGRRKGLT